MADGKPGRPSLGDRKRKSLRFGDAVCALGEGRAAELGMSFNQWVENVVARELGIVDGAAAHQEELQLSA